jgi:uncharacterized protein
MHEFPQGELTFKLEGAVGALEVMTVWEDHTPHLAVMLICHPHPLHQGTMHNKVVTTLAKAAKNVGISSVRFNFRGVGESQGEFAHAVGEQDDLLAVISWVRKVLPQYQIILAGFSFGSYVAAAVAARIDCVSLVTVAPAVHHYDYSLLPGMRCPWMVVMGEDDEVVPVAAVDTFVASREDVIVYEKMSACSHFFHGKLIELRALVEQWLF